MRGIALMDLGDPQQGIELMRLAVIDRNMSGMRWHRPFALAMLAAGESRCQRWGPAAMHFDQSLHEVEATDERWFEAEIYRLKGEFLLERRREADAVPCFEESLRIARSQGAKAWELRTLLSLARVLRARGGGLQARELLMPVYRSFTEGLDTADLVDASALLNELGTQ